MLYCTTFHTACYVLLYSMLGYDNVILHQIITCFAMWCNLLSFHVISYHTMLWYGLASYCKIVSIIKDCILLSYIMFYFLHGNIFSLYSLVLQFASH